MSVVLRKSVLIHNKRGLHARAASKFSRVARRFAADIKVKREDNQVDGRSIMGLMLLNAGIGTTIDIECQGPEAEGAMAALVELVRAKFGEEA